jgi:hypothetical protein
VIRKGKDKNIPYPGVPPSKTKDVESCVKQIMSDPKFKPRKGQSKKSSAIAVCVSSIMGKSSDSAQQFVIKLLNNKNFDVGKGGEENMAKVQKDVEVKVEDSKVKKQDPVEEVKEEVAVDESPKKEVVTEEKKEEVKEEVKEEAPVEGEAKVEPEVEAPVKEPSEEKPAEKAPVEEVKVEGEEVANPNADAISKILDKISKLEDLLVKKDNPVEEVKEEDKVVEEVVEEEEPKEEVKIEDVLTADELEKADDKVRLCIAEQLKAGKSKEEAIKKCSNKDESKVAIVDTSVGSTLQKIESQLSEVLSKFENFDARLKTVEGQPLPSKVFSPVAVKKGDSMVSGNSEEINKINIRLKELEDLKASNIKKYQDERKWDEAFELLGKRDQLILGR